MSMIDRIKNICLTPKTEWPVIAGETTATATLMTGYVLPLAAIGAVAGFISSSIIGHSIPFLGGTFRTPILMGAGVAIFTLIMAVVGVFILSLVINALAPSFGGQKDPAQALKVAVYAYTPAWIGGIFKILPWVGSLLVLLCALYCLYLLFTGLPALMKNPEDKSLGYTVVVVICAIVIGVVVAVLSSCFLGAGALATGAATSGFSRGASSDVTFDKDSPLGKLSEFGKQMEKSGKAMEAAQKSGDQKAQAEAAAAAMGAMFSGGKKIDPLPLDQLKSFVPESFAGLGKKSSSAETTGIAGLAVAKATASYGDDSGKSASLDISDGGSASGIMGLASWVNVQGEKEDQYGSEKTQKVGGRMVHEKSSKQQGGSNEYTVMLGDRFIVSAKGNGVDLGALKSAVNGLDLGKLEGMKDIGVQK